MPGVAIAGGLGLLAALAYAALRIPAPEVSSGQWVVARMAALPVGLLWLVSATVLGRPLAFAVAMVTGAVACLVAWVLRAEPLHPPREDDDGPGGGGPGADDDPPGDGPGGGGIDWDAFEREAFAAWKAQGRRPGSLPWEEPWLPRTPSTPAPSSTSAAGRTRSTGSTRSRSATTSRGCPSR